VVKNLRRLGENCCILYRGGASQAITKKRTQLQDHRLRGGGRGESNTVYASWEKALYCPALWWGNGNGGGGRGGALSSSPGIHRRADPEYSWRGGRPEKKGYSSVCRRERGKRAASHVLEGEGTSSLAPVITGKRKWYKEGGLSPRKKLLQNIRCLGKILFPLLCHWEVENRTGGRHLDAKPSLSSGNLFFHTRKEQARGRKKGGCLCADGCLGRGQTTGSSALIKGEFLSKRR